MEYVKIEYQVPKGYEAQFDALVERKIEGILSQIFLTPTADKKAEYEAEVLAAKEKNKK